MPVRLVPEFEAWGRGAPALAAHLGSPLPARYLPVDVIGTALCLGCGVAAATLSLGLPMADRLSRAVLQRFSGVFLFGLAGQYFTDFHDPYPR